MLRAGLGKSIGMIFTSANAMQCWPELVVAKGIAVLHAEGIDKGENGHHVRSTQVQNENSSIFCYCLSPALQCKCFEFDPTRFFYGDFS